VSPIERDRAREKRRYEKHQAKLESRQVEARRNKQVLGIVLAATLILSSWGMLDTTNLLLQRQFVDVQGQDAEVYFATVATVKRAGPVPVSQAVAAVAAVPGVAAAEPVVDVAASVNSA